MLIVFSFVFSSNEACEIDVELESRTNVDFYIQLIASNETSTRLYHMTSKGQSQLLQLQHELCFTKPTELKVWQKRPEDKRTPPNGEIKMILDGMGQIRFSVEDDLQPKATGRVGVLCSFGPCGRG